MPAERNTSLKLGAFVLGGTIVLLLALYLIGNKRDMFTDTLHVTSAFREVNGLRPGNNVRFAGIDVGTVQELEMQSDTVVIVHLAIQAKAAKHIRTNAVTRIGSDGLMGNKLVNIEASDGTGEALVDGSALRSAGSLDTDAMLRTLGRSNDNLEAITTDLRELVRRISGDSGLVSILTDERIALAVGGTLEDLQGTASNARSITAHVDQLVAQVQAGKGALGALAADPQMEEHVRGMLTNLQSVSDSLAAVSAQLGKFSSGLNDPNGSLYALTKDTAVANDMRRILANLDTSSATLNEDLKALQRNFLFRRYFKEKARKEKK
jgi:phospholipid/cholesterol/gamma-HCH transport system substrate-binding protein